MVSEMLENKFKYSTSKFQLLKSVLIKPYTLKYLKLIAVFILEVKLNKNTFCVT